MEYFTTHEVNRLYFQDGAGVYGYYEYLDGFWKRFQCESVNIEEFNRISEDEFTGLLMERK